MNGRMPGQAELRDLIRKRWNEVLTPPDEPDVDFVQASLAAETALAALAATERRPAPEAVHLMTVDMTAWCGATGPGNGRASSQWREVTCPACTAKRAERLLALVWEMLQTMGPSREALSFAVRAGRLGVTDEQGGPLAMACAPAEEDDPAERDDVLRIRSETAREAGDDSPGGDL